MSLLKPVGDLDGWVLPGCDDGDSFEPGYINRAFAAMDRDQEIACAHYLAGLPIDAYDRVIAKAASLARSGKHKRVVLGVID